MISFFRRKKELDVNEFVKKEVAITDLIYEQNLYFYTILKNLVQVGFSENQLITLQSIILKNKDNYKDDFIGLQSVLLDSGAVIKDGTKKYENFLNLVNLIDEDKYDAWTSMMDVAIDLILFKDLILQEAKAYVIGQQKDSENRIEDKLCLEYDMSNLCLPYGQKVISSLLVYALTDIERKSEFIMNSSGKHVKEINSKLNYLVKNYNINCNNMLLLIVDESVSQSIKSTAGSSYEDRVQLSLTGKVENLDPHSHDSNITAMEYDFTFNLNGKKAGISAKRTLRERYKQNHEDIDILDVDYVFLFTLGTDLNKDKLEHILQKNGIYVVVASEIYDARDYLKNNPRVISSKNLSKETLEGLMK